jgi:AraC-like DNA-binding protein
MNWITREKPKIDRIASPWLLKNFVDKEAVFFFVPFEKVLETSEACKGTPFDIPGVEYTHYGEETTFDYILKKHGLKDPALKKLSVIVRGADTDRPELAPEVAGLWAISAGLSYNIQDDHLLLETGFKIYDALYSWVKYLDSVKHLENSPFEKHLHEVYIKFLKAQPKKNAPKWVNELKLLIQDQLDAQFNIDLKFFAEELNLNATYLSREFSKHFDNKNFGEYIREKRIQRAIILLKNPSYSLTEIAYLTGFSDQSHFTKTFQNVIGSNPSSYRKNLVKGKSDTKSK